MGKSTISMAMFNSYVSLPEGSWAPCNSISQRTWDGLKPAAMAMDGSIGLRFVGLYSTDAKVPMIQKAPPFNSVPLPCAEIQV